MSELLPAVILEPAGQADASVIWLHGLGADGHDFEPIVPELRLPASLQLRFIFPHAPRIPVSLNNGFVMPAWFDVEALDGERRINSHQLLASAAAVHRLIDREVAAGIASDRIILAGFSQGGAVNYQAALTYDKPLAGLLALSSFFPSAEAVTPHPANHRLPILVCHGSEDPVLDLRLGERSVSHLQKLGYHPEFRIYPMPHSVCPEEIRDVSGWIQGLLG